MGPLLTGKVCRQLATARKAGTQGVHVSLDLDRSISAVSVSENEWCWNDASYPYMEKCKERTIYFWTGTAFQPLARFSQSLIKLIPTEWGAPTFEIDGIKMLPTATVSPYEDARAKVELIEPKGKAILDTCGGLGYFASWCLQKGAVRIESFEKNADVIWLRTLNPWSPQVGGALTLTHAAIDERIASLPSESFDAALHDPPRFGIAGELYSQAFYDELARVLKPRGKLFHYTGTPNKLTTGRDVPNEVIQRLRNAGFTAERSGDGVFAIKKRSAR